MAAIVSSDLPNEISPGVNKLVGEFEQLARREIQERKLNPLLIPMNRNHNRFVGVDSSTVHIVYTTEGVTSAIVSGTDRDLRKHGPLAQQQIVQSCVRELGYKDVHYFGLPASVLSQSVEERKPVLQRTIDQYIQARIQPLIKLEKLGLSETMTYLQNARSRFETRTPEGYSDCKSNCRNALVSCVTALTEQDDMRKGARILNKKGLLGHREGELVEALGELLAKLYSAASKKGSHPPLADEDEAELVLAITSAAVNYMTNRAIRSL